MEGNRKGLVERVTALEAAMRVMAVKVEKREHRGCAGFPVWYRSREMRLLGIPGQAQRALRENQPQTMRDAAALKGIGRKTLQVLFTAGLPDPDSWYSMRAKDWSTWQADELIAEEKLAYALENAKR